MWKLSGLLLLLHTVSTIAEPILDQFFNPPTVFGTRIGVLNGKTRELAQSFTVGLDGLLSGVDLYLRQKGAPTETLNVTIVPVSAQGVPERTPVLARAVIKPYDLGETFTFHHVDLTSSNIMVVAGQELAVIMSSNQDYARNRNEYATDGNWNGGYTGGDAWVSENGGVFKDFLDFEGLRESDLFFKTYIDPEPSEGPVEDIFNILDDLPNLTGTTRIGLVFNVAASQSFVKEACDQANNLFDQAIVQVEGFQDEVLKKMSGNKTQIPNEEGQSLLELADELLEQINTLKQHLL